MARKLRASRGAHRGWEKRYKAERDSARRPRFARLSEEDRAKMLRHWVATDQVPRGFRIVEEPTP